MTNSAPELLTAAQDGGNFKSTFCRLDIQPQSDDLWVFCSHVGIPQGKFAQTRVGRQFYGDKLYLNCPDNNWYQDGVPELCGRFEDIAGTVAEVARRRARKRVYVVGHSMGAYLAIFLGSQIEGARYFAISPEPDLLLKGSRSARHKIRPAPPLKEIIRREAAKHGRAPGRNGLVLYGVFDPVDAYFLQHPDVLGGEYGLVREVFWHHGITEYFNGRDAYVGLLKEFAEAGSLADVGKSDLSEPGAYGAPEQYALFYDVLRAQLDRDLKKARALADAQAGWANPGWQYYRSRIYAAAGDPQRAYDAAALAYRDAPHVYEHAIQLGRTAIARDDIPALRRLLEAQPRDHYNHVNYERFHDEARQVLAGAGR